MKALKQKQKEKSQKLITLESFTIKEGIHQDHFFEHQTREFGISTIQTVQDPKIEHIPKNMSDSLK